MARRKNKLFKTTISGRGHFPIDMLRYDQCWPAEQQDVESIGLSVAHSGQDETHTIQVLSQYPPTTARWMSFSWKVEKTVLLELS